MIAQVTSDHRWKIIFPEFEEANLDIFTEDFIEVEQIEKSEKM